ncbi:hypothetical protein CONCODRAFT_73136 [Conidiobolus coronatus NRRL 28638]|uniref:F-box domain-containing protein n=1 Tax=Conidiobolus coronatus (strain ATCC 28846 / CBS 209.66 / NRRL 28638) TaxID=796925 RepID=A0A137NWM1_CONC2|nr:hypothetical protein CONCODRAFT_73136 [Conidiobolus coronatus NRRL 28638]|eukprot:KXN67235.1 hypothetical protein CONCODRAFT_73136 [Conidiobolus coronatus NRRL 28638]
MKVVNWNLILQKPEFYEYLPILDIFQLSLINNLIRNRLKCVIFSRFNITKYFKKEYKDKIEKDLESNNIETWPSYFDDYLSDIKLSLLNFPHKQFIKQLSYNETVPLSFINLSLLEIFPNLIHLEFIRVKVPFESILNIFNRLNNLELLDLHFVSIIKIQNDNFNGSDLIFPTSLKTLKFGDIDIIVSKLDHYPNLLNYDYALDIESIQEIYIQPQSLPNLQSFNYLPRISSSLTENTQNFLNFLNLNKNLKVLQTLPKYFDKDIVKGLSNINKLTKLKLGHFFKHSKIPNASYPKINSVTNLNLSLDFLGRIYFEEATKLFPNVKTLYLDCHYHSQQLFSVIFANFPKITNLTIKTKEGINTSMFKSFNLANIEAICLYSERYSQYELSDFDHFPDLSRITIQYDYVQGFDGVFLEEHYNKFTKWRYFVRWYRIQCYKI